MPGGHVAHFCPMCLTARNGLRHPKSPVMSRTSPTRFDAWSSRGGRPEWTLGGAPARARPARRALEGGTLCPFMQHCAFMHGLCDVCWKGVLRTFCTLLYVRYSLSVV